MNALRIALLTEIALSLTLLLDTKEWFQIAPDSNFSGWLLLIIWPGYWLLLVALIVSTLLDGIAAVKKRDRKSVTLNLINVGLFLICSILYFSLWEHITPP